MIVVLLLNFGLVTGFIFFYRMKRKHWGKSKEAEGGAGGPRREDIPPPLPPHNSRHGAMYSQAGGQEVIFKSAYDNTRSRAGR